MLQKVNIYVLLVYYMGFKIYFNRTSKNYIKIMIIKYLLLTHYLSLIMIEIFRLSFADWVFILYYVFKSKTYVAIENAVIR